MGASLTLAAENEADGGAETTANSPLLGCKTTSQDVENTMQGLKLLTELISFIALLNSNCQLFLEKKSDAPEKTRS